jgi:hypothetical protein
MDYYPRGYTRQQQERDECRIQFLGVMGRLFPGRDWEQLDEDEQRAVERECEGSHDWA